MYRRRHKRPSKVSGPLKLILCGFIGVILGVALLAAVLYHFGFGIILAIPCQAAARGF